MDGMRLIHSGDDWDHARPPCAKDMTGFLEHNEKIVSWVQPVSGGVDDQIPVVRFNGAYYRLSLRMMKSVWRHIRLKKGFVNREAAPYGGVKLRIPQLLFLEKKRTQARFNVSRAASESAPGCGCLLKEIARQVMRMDTSGATAKDRKQVQNASNKISCVVHRVLLPLLSAEIPQFVSFRAVSRLVSVARRALYPLRAGGLDGPVAGPGGAPEGRRALLRQGPGQLRRAHGQPVRRVLPRRRGGAGGARAPRGGNPR